MRLMLNNRTYVLRYRPTYPIHLHDGRDFIQRVNKTNNTIYPIDTIRMETLDTTDYIKFRYHTEYMGKLYTRGRE